LLLTTVAAWPTHGQQEVNSPDLLPAAEPLAPKVEPASLPPIRLPHEHHCWCRLQPGAWRTLRVSTETFEPTGKSLGVVITSETETLGDVQEGNYALRSQTVVEVGGKSLSGPDREHRLQLLTDTADERIDAVAQTQAEIDLDGRAISCNVWRLTVTRSDRQIAHAVYYNNKKWPFVLRREVTETAMQDPAAPLFTMREDVIRSEIPVAIDGKIVPGAQLQSIAESPTGRTERLEVHSEAVPGGLVSRATTEWDAQGNRIRWSTTELVDFGTTERERRPLRRFLRRR
jgi:hypothetical protein